MYNVIAALCSRFNTTHNLSGCYLIISVIISEIIVTRNTIMIVVYMHKGSGAFCSHVVRHVATFCDKRTTNERACEAITTNKIAALGSHRLPGAQVSLERCDNWEGRYFTLFVKCVHLYRIIYVILVIVIGPYTIIYCKTSKSGAQIEPDHKLFVTDKYRIFRFDSV